MEMNADFEFGVESHLLVNFHYSQINFCYSKANFGIPPQKLLFRSKFGK